MHNPPHKHIHPQCAFSSMPRIHLPSRLPSCLPSHFPTMPRTPNHPPFATSRTESTVSTSATRGRCHLPAANCRLEQQATQTSSPPCHVPRMFQDRQATHPPPSCLHPLRRCTEHNRTQQRLLRCTRRQQQRLVRGSPSLHQHKALSRPTRAGPQQPRLQRAQRAREVPDGEGARTARNIRLPQPPSTHTLPKQPRPHPRSYVAKSRRAPSAVIASISSSCWSSRDMVGSTLPEPQDAMTLSSLQRHNRASPSVIATGDQAFRSLPLWLGPQESRLQGPEACTGPGAPRHEGQNSLKSTSK